MLYTGSHEHPPESPACVASWELANRVLQATGAIFLLALASRDPDLAEIHLAIDRVGEWLHELNDDTRSSDLETRKELAPVVSSLGRVTIHLRQLLEPGAAGLSVAAPILANDLSAAAAALARASGGAQIQAGFLSSCCAADVSHLAERRETQ